MKSVSKEKLGENTSHDRLVKKTLSTLFQSVFMLIVEIQKLSLSKNFDKIELSEGNRPISKTFKERRRINKEKEYDKSLEGRDSWRI